MKIKHYCLITKEVTETHSAENHAEELHQGLMSGICLIRYIITDNCKKIVNAVVVHLNVLHIPCIGHTLKVGVQKGIYNKSCCKRFRKGMQVSRTLP